VAPTTNEWINPIEGEVVVTSPFGPRLNPVLAVEEFHNGIDIAANIGTNVLAVKSGTIIEIRESETFGKMLTFVTESGFRVMYAHLSEVKAEVGDNVLQGQIIARSGNTGLSTGPHLHYSVWAGDELANPIKFITKQHGEVID